jgi:hypothetical protein
MCSFIYCKQTTLSLNSVNYRLHQVDLLLTSANQGRDEGKKREGNSEFEFSSDHKNYLKCGDIYKKRIKWMYINEF